MIRNVSLMLTLVAAKSAPNTYTEIDQTVSQVSGAPTNDSPLLRPSRAVLPESDFSDRLLVKEPQT